MKKKNLSRKRYFGNALTNAFFPVLASLGLTLGATCVTVTTKKSSSASGEISKSHDIEIVQPKEPEQQGWMLNCTTASGEKKAKKGEKVTFYATEETQLNAVSKKPKGVKINEQSTYDFDLDMKVEVEIQFIEKMKAELVFPDGKDEHTVKFDLGYDPEGEKSRYSNVAVQHNHDCVEPPVPARQGYTFTGWYKQGESQKFVFVNNPILSDITLVAQWAATPEVYSHEISSGLIESGWSLTITTPTHDSRAKINEHVQFDVKCDSSTYEGTRFPDSIQLVAGSDTMQFPLKLVSKTEQTYTVDVIIPFAKDMTANVNFVTASPCLVAFDSQGGSGIESQTVAFQGRAEEPSTPPSRTGYTFKYWYFDNIKVAFDFADTPITQDITLKALWETKTSNVLFLDHDGTTLKQEDVKFGKMPTAPNDPTREDTPEFTYRFIGWEPAIHTVTEGEGTNTYTAKYSNTTREYSVTFNTNGGTSVDKQFLKYGDKIDPLSATTTKVGYKDPVWCTDEGCQTPWNFDTDTIKGTTTLYCRWTPEVYDIQFLNYNHEVLATVPTNYNETPICPVTPTKPVDEHGQAWSHSGWEPALKPVDGPATYIATFAKSQGFRTVSFNTNGGTYIQSQQVEFNHPILTKPTDPTKEGYIFDGWYKDASYQTPWVFGEGGTAVTLDTTLYAKWKEQTFTITFIDKYGSKEPQVLTNIKYNTIPSTSMVPTTPTSAEHTYSFKTWGVEKEGGGIEEGIKPAQSDITYIPVFNEAVHKYTVKFNTDGAESPISPVIADFGSQIDEPTKPTKTHFTFSKWVDQNGDEWKFTAGKSEKTVDGDYELKAIWEKEKYTITFYELDGITPVEEAKQWAYEQTPTCTKDPIPPPEKEHHTYKFVGWKEVGSSTIGIKQATKDTSYIPVFNDEVEIVHGVTFNLNGGSGCKEFIYVPADSPIPESCCDPKSPSSDTIFGGWFQDPYFTKPWDNSTPVTSNLTLYAEWIPPYREYSLGDFEFTWIEGNKYAIKAKSTQQLPKKFSLRPKDGNNIITRIDRMLGDEIQEVHIPYTVTTLSDLAFSYRDKITTINLNNVSTFGYQSFWNCYSLSKGSWLPTGDNPIVMANSTIHIGTEAFLFCYAMKNINIVNPDNSETKLTTYDYPWRGSNITDATIHLPLLTSTSSLGTNVFSGFTSVIAFTFKGTSAQFAEAATHFKTSWNAEFPKDSEGLYRIYCEASKNYYTVK